VWPPPWCVSLALLPARVSTQGVDSCAADPRVSVTAREQPDHGCYRRDGALYARIARCTHDGAWANVHVDDGGVVQSRVKTAVPPLIAKEYYPVAQRELRTVVGYLRFDLKELAELSGSKKANTALVATAKKDVCPAPIHPLKRPPAV
jgi:hypothetical protein